MFNLALVYFLEYLILTCFADRISRKVKRLDPNPDGSFEYVNGFNILNFCYQFGVFISRSSLPLLKI